MLISTLQTAKWNTTPNGLGDIYILDENEKTIAIVQSAHPAADAIASQIASLPEFLRECVGAVEMLQNCHEHDACEAREKLQVALNGFLHPQQQQTTI